MLPATSIDALPVRSSALFVERTFASIKFPFGSLKDGQGKERQREMGGRKESLCPPPQFGDNGTLYLLKRSETRFACF